MEIVKKRMTLAVNLLVISITCGCMSAAQHQQSLGSTKEREMTLGVVQKEIRVGMSQADVATSLGSPNIVTKDIEGKETWIYDKIATDVVYSQSDAGIKFLTVGSSGAISKNQRTLTVIIKFDSDGKVRDFSYHTSSF